MLSRMSNHSSCRVCSIFDIPDEILARIFLHFNVRKRLAIADSCTRFHDLVFGDKELMRTLDFSKNGRLVTMKQIEQYFNDKTECELVLKVDMQNVNCIKGGKMLTDTIGRAINLVDVNIHGTEFKDIEELGSFLKPLSHLKRLSVDWPEQAKENGLSTCLKVLEKPFSTLVYLSVKVCVYSDEFLPTVQVCDQLKELRITATAPADRTVRNKSWDRQPNKLKNLQIVQARGWYSVGSLKDYVVTMVPDPHLWTDFQLVDIFRSSGFYLEKNVEVCKELRKTKLMEFVPYLYLYKPFDFGWFLNSENLLTEVIKLTHKDAPEKFCCLTPFRSDPIRNVEEEPCLLKVEEAKQLLIDPEYQISFLHFKHSIAPDCDAHLVASAFPNLKELNLTHIIKNEDGAPSVKAKNYERRLRRRGAPELEEQEIDAMISDSSFKMLIENTPKVEDLTISARNILDEGFGRWDLEALNLIPLWKNLRILCLSYVPVKNGKFLIQIGKQCPKLEKLILSSLGFSRPCCYTKDLSVMLNDCKNLVEFSIDQGEVNEVPEILVALSQNLGIKRVHINNFSKKYDSAILIPAIEKLLHSCKKLNTFVIIIGLLSDIDSQHLTSALRRIKGELNRPKFQFQSEIPRHSSDQSQKVEFDIIHIDAPASFFPRTLDWLGLL